MLINGTYQNMTITRPQQASLNKGGYWANHKKKKTKEVPLQPAKVPKKHLPRCLEPYRSRARPSSESSSSSKSKSNDHNNNKDDGKYQHQ